MNLKVLTKEIVSFFNSVSGIVTDKIKNKKNNSKKLPEERFDIGIDDIKNAHEKIPKKMGLIIIGSGLLMMAIMSAVTLNKKISKADDNRTIIDETKLKEPEVQISIDEQGWKHFQSKRIDMVTENTQKTMENLKKEVKESSEALSATVKEDLNETRNIVKGYVEQLNFGMDSLKVELSEQLKSTLENVDEKIRKSETVLQEKIQKTNSSSLSSKTPMFNADSKLLPPPLNEVSRDENNRQKVVLTEEVILKPDAKNYTFDDVVIDSVVVQSGDISTSLYSKTLIKNENEKIVYHIMKGLTNATLLTGINAPTFGGSNNKNPAPVLFSVDGEILIANDEIENIENCLISGSATGNVNTSKADILLTEISCSGYDHDGNKVKIEEQIKGWAIGEDGSFGLQGRLLDSSGKVITKMIALEIIQALSEAMVAKSMPQGTSSYGLGTQTNIPYNSAAQQGLGSGINSGLDHTFEHYSQILTGMYPTISVMAGKKVSLHLKGGEDLSPVLYNGLDIDEKLESSKKSEEKK